MNFVPRRRAYTIHTEGTHAGTTLMQLRTLTC